VRRSSCFLPVTSDCHRPFKSADLSRAAPVPGPALPSQAESPPRPPKLPPAALLLPPEEELPVAAMRYVPSPVENYQFSVSGCNRLRPEKFAPCQDFR